MKKGNLEKFWNYVCLEEEEKEEEERKERPRNLQMQELRTGIREKRINIMEWIDREEWR